MKKLAISVIFLLPSFLCLAQLGTIGIAFGPQVGVNYTMLKDNISTNVSRSASNGLSAGLFVRAKIYKFFIQPEFDYSSQNTRFSVLGNNGTDRFYAANFPVMVGIYALHVETIGLRVFVGPEISMIGKYTSQGVTIDKVKSNYTSLNIGVGADFWRLALDVRYKIGLSNLSSDPDGSIKVNQFLMKLGFKILNKGK